MSQYRPITDLWLLARAKLKGGKKYYGAYLGGFPERARALIGCPLNEPLLHVCGGMARYYPYPAGFGPNDETLDIDPATEPDWCVDAQEFIPALSKHSVPWGGILIDPPYSEADALHYKHTICPSPNRLLTRALHVLTPHHKVGIIHYLIPKAPDTKLTALVGVACGFNNRIRAFSVFEKLS